MNQSTKTNKTKKNTVFARTAFSAGKRLGGSSKLGRSAADQVKAGQLWADWYAARKNKVRKWNTYHRAAKAFLRGLYGKRKAPDWVLPPVAKPLDIVVTAMNEERTLPRLLRQLGRLPQANVVVVVNGATDRSFEVSRDALDAAIVHFTDPLGHDVGRGVGAKLTRSEIVLFLDGDMVVKAEELIPFISSIASGDDVALNRIDPLLPLFHRRDSVTYVKQFLNHVLGHSKLGAASMTAVPHALSRRAIDVIGYPNLVVPPKAQTIAALSGLRISAPGIVNVIQRNRVRSLNAGEGNPVAELIIGDHIEALQHALEVKGNRMTFPDLLRLRGEFVQ
ncbi:glycosyltransferase [Paenibacillus turpanensis]|uniref:glycosyltransferase n=1 Tax=Paenibacillus turpanensis TaxID=2689078 RepID=UPI001FB5A119|nr:glycosyltransferase [Paenibacillus turpanensis]